MICLLIVQIKNKSVKKLDVFKEQKVTGVAEQRAGVGMGDGEEGMSSGQGGRQGPTHTRLCKLR